MKIYSPTSHNPISNSIIYNEHYNEWNDILHVIYNTKPLPIFYNEIIHNIINDTTIPDDDIIIFCHDDIIFLEPQKVEKVIHENLNQYDIIGVAGTSKAAIGYRNLWHLMCLERPFNGAVGEIYHGTKTEHIYSKFGPSPARAILLDGVFFAFTKSVFLKGLKYDETNPSGFHFYDLDLCLTANNLKLKMGVAPIPIIHKSPGLKDINDLRWNLGNTWFIKKWSPSLAAHVI